MSIGTQGVIVSQRAFLLRVVSSNASRTPGEEIRVSSEATLGRDPACTIVLAEPSVSRRHARVEPDAAGLRFVDLGSGNGIWVGARRVTDVVLAPGQQCRIGSTVFECVEDAPAAPAAAPDPAATVFIGSIPVEAVAPAAAGFVIE